MYCVFWMTPPHIPAAMVATASVSRMSRARYSSPAAMADSVLSMPPMTVAMAKGAANDRYGSAASIAGTHASVGHGMARTSAAGGAASDAGPAPSAALSQKMPAPTATAANAPGRPPGSLTRPTSVTNTMASDVTPTSGSAKTLSAGRNATSRMATPAIEPSSAARGTSLRTPSPAKARTSLSAPIATVTAMPTFQASSASPVSSMTGPSTPKTMPNSDGVSIPNGMAVTSSRPVRRMRRTASTV